MKTLRFFVAFRNYLFRGGNRSYHSPQDLRILPNKPPHRTTSDRWIHHTNSTTHQIRPKRAFIQTSKPHIKRLYLRSAKCLPIARRTRHQTLRPPHQPRQPPHCPPQNAKTRVNDPVHRRHNNESHHVNSMRSLWRDCDFD